MSPAEELPPEPVGLCRRFKPGETVFMIRKSAAGAEVLPQAAQLITRCRILKDRTNGVYVQPLDVEEGQRPVSEEGAFCARALYFIFDEYAAALECAALMIGRVLVELEEKQGRAAGVLEDLRARLMRELLPT